MKKCCENCKLSDHASCMLEYEGKLICRKCQVFNKGLSGLWECDCCEWSKDILISKIFSKSFSFKCNDCNQDIKQRIIDYSRLERFNCIKVKHDDLVNNPSHYQGRSFEVIDIIEDFNLGFNLGNALKYILRSGHKGDKRTDLKKAIWYLQREVDND